MEEPYLTEEGIVDYRPTNREKKLKPKGGLFWCINCDAQKVRQWEKCPNCGHRNSPRKMKPNKY